MTSRWITRTPNPTAPHRIYFFPHAGGSAAEYLHWGKALQETDVCVVQLPGRGPRLGEAPVTDIRTLVAELLAGEEFATPYAFFGHSFGALLAYELACALRDAGRPLPRKLVLSSASAPHVPRRYFGARELDDDELLAAVQARHGGIPEEVLAYADMREMIAAALRADYTVLEDYTWPGHAPLPVPFAVLAGEDEELARGGALGAWGEYTTAGAVPVRTFPGGHFYLRGDGAPAVRRAVAELLRADVHS
ncbi:thioesterase II family protein [Streptomyces sp. NPDC002537]